MADTLTKLLKRVAPPASHGTWFSVAEQHAARCDALWHEVSEGFWAATPHEVRRALEKEALCTAVAAWGVDTDAGAPVDEYIAAIPSSCALAPGDHRRVGAGSTATCGSHVGTGPVCAPVACPMPVRPGKLIRVPVPQVGEAMTPARAAVVVTAMPETSLRITASYLLSRNLMLAPTRWWGALDGDKQCEPLEARMRRILATGPSRDRVLVACLHGCVAAKANSAAPVALEPPIPPCSVARSVWSTRAASTVVQYNVLAPWKHAYTVLPQRLRGLLREVDVGFMGTESMGGAVWARSPQVFIEANSGEGNRPSNFPCSSLETSGYSSAILSLNTCRPAAWFHARRHEFKRVPELHFRCNATKEMGLLTRDWCPAPPLQALAALTCAFPRELKVDETDDLRAAFWGHGVGART